MSWRQQRSCGIYDGNHRQAGRLHAAGSGSRQGDGGADTVVARLAITLVPKFSHSVVKLGKPLVRFDVTPPVTVLFRRRVWSESCSAG